MLLSQLIVNTTEKYPQKNAIICGSDKITYQDYNCRASKLANALIGGAGLKRQDRVAVYLENSIESAVSIFGILKAGGVFLVINPQVRSKKLAYILNDCQVRAIITDKTGATELFNSALKCPYLETVLITNYGKNKDAFFISDKRIDSDVTIQSFESYVNGFDSREIVNNYPDIDTASLLYTSGSTGDPKGVIMTHLNMITAIESITTYLQNRPDDIILNYLPLAFDYGLYQVLMSCCFGGTIVMEKAFAYPFQMIQKIIDEKVTGIPLVPAMAALILHLKELSNYDFNSVRYITNTGQALPVQHIEKLQSIFSKAKIYSMYGLTECKRATYLPPDQLASHPQSVGIAIPNTEVWLVDNNGQVITTPGEIGELVIRGSHVMKGYWNKPAETEMVLKEGKYPNEKILLSGDYFRMDKDGYLYFVSRKDDIIKSGGERISPKEIEEVIYELDAISEVAVISVPDNILGYAVKAYVALKYGEVVTEEQILKHCKASLEKSRIPKYIQILDSLPKSSNGKIDKKMLKINENVCI